MQTLMRAVMMRAEFQEFTRNHPVHDAVSKAFVKHFQKGLTLKDLPCLVFTGKPSKSNIKNAA